MGTSGLRLCQKQKSRVITYILLKSNSLTQYFETKNVCYNCLKHMNIEPRNWTQPVTKNLMFQTQGIRSPIHWLNGCRRPPDNQIRRHFPLPPDRRRTLRQVEGSLWMLPHGLHRREGRWIRLRRPQAHPRHCSHRTSRSFPDFPWKQARRRRCGRPDCQSIVEVKMHCWVSLSRRESGAENLNQLFYSSYTRAIIFYSKWILYFYINDVSEHWVLIWKSSF